MATFQDAASVKPFLFSKNEIRDYAAELSEEETWLVSGGPGGQQSIHPDPDCENGTTNCNLSTGCSSSVGCCELDDPTCDAG